SMRRGGSFGVSFIAGGILAGAALACTGCGPVDDLAADAGCPHDPPTCRRHTLLSCDEARQTVETPCGDQRCAADAPSPRCVPAGALPCAEDDPPRCRNGLLETCDPASLYPESADCGAGRVCVERRGEGDCAEVGAVPCDPAGAT